MFIYIKNIKRKLMVFLGLILIVFVIIIVKKSTINKNHIMIGAFIHTEKEMDNQVNDSELSDQVYEDIGERFERPSKLPRLKLKYDFIRPDFDKGPPYGSKGFPSKYETSEDVIQAYYAILRNAANMRGYHGGCGTILWPNIHPVAYELLSHDAKENISLEEYVDSFKGIGAMSLLQLTPAYKPPNTPDNIMYYFVEVEVLKGHKRNEDKKSEKSLPNYFEYYYGIVTTEYDENEGWKIKSVNYLPEVYLCRPLHGWDYDYRLFLGVVYNNWYGMNLTFDEEEIKNNYIQVYASNEEHEYKFDFIRLTNGEDVLLHEYIKENDKWKEETILKPEHLQFYKISILHFNEE